MLPKYERCQLPKEQNKTLQFSQIYKCTPEVGEEPDPPGKAWAEQEGMNKALHSLFFAVVKCTEHGAHSSGLDSATLTVAMRDGLLPPAGIKGWLYLQSPTELNRVCVLNHRDAEIWSLEEFFEEKAILHYFAAC